MLLNGNGGSVHLIFVRFLSLVDVVKVAVGYPEPRRKQVVVVGCPAANRQLNDLLFFHLSGWWGEENVAEFVPLGCSTLCQHSGSIFNYPHRFFQLLLCFA